MTATLSLFRNVTDCESFSAGQTIFQEGQPGEVMYAVTEGEVEILVRDKVINNTRRRTLMRASIAAAHISFLDLLHMREECYRIPSSVSAR